MIRERLKDGETGIVTCFTGLKPWDGSDSQDDCILNPKLCDVNAKCELKNATFACSCIAGYPGIKMSP